MQAAIITLVVLVVLFGAWVVWRWTSVARGARQRDAKLIDQIDLLGQKIDAGESISPEEIDALAAKPEMRFLLFHVLRELKPELLPTSHLSSVDQGETALAYWMMHPNELQDAPESIEWVETLKRPVNGSDAEFHVFRYKMPAGHWGATDGWILGLAGPMPEGAEPYSEMPGAFSRCGDQADKVKPSELVDWYVGMLRQKGAIR
jgi:hypothetical protein